MARGRFMAWAFCRSVPLCAVGWLTGKWWCGPLLVVGLWACAFLCVRLERMQGGPR